MRLLVDTNIYLEVLLNQANASEARLLLSAVNEHEFFISDFALHSIGLALFRQRKHSAFQVFLEDMVTRVSTAVLTCTVADMISVAKWAQEFSLDFDDAYQYCLTENEDLILVSYDSDFDRTTRGRRTPGQILSALP